MNVLLWILVTVFALVLFLIFTPLHAEITYHIDGFSAAVRIYFLRFRFPREKGNVKPKAKEKDKPPKQKKGGDLKRLISLLRLGIQCAGKLLSKIRIRNLVIDATIASEDPFQTAMMFGGSGAGVGILLPLIERHFKLEKRKVNVRADFESEESTIVLFADCSVLLGQLIAIALSFAYNLWKEQKMKTPVKRKDESNGRAKSE